MRRRTLGRDLGLSVRMTVALVLLLATYAGLVAGVAWLVVYRPGYAVYWSLVGLALVIALVSHYRGAVGSLLRAVSARIAVADEKHEVQDVLERLASLADIPPPRLAIAETDAPNALAVGLRQRDSIVVVTRGLLQRLDPRELEAVLAHEVAHLAHRDAAVMTAVAVPRTLGEVVVGGAGSGLGLVWMLVWPLGLLPLGIGTGLTLTVSRYREYAADRGSALLTGAPEELMSALQKLAGDAGEIPHDDLRAANAFCIVSTEARRFALFADHPALEKRLAALAEIAREMGRPIS